MKHDLEAITAAVDRALRELAPAALDAAGLSAHAVRLRAMRPASVGNGAYSADVVHAAFAEARRLMHAASASDDQARARELGYAGAIAHAAADACAALGASKLGGVHFLHGAKLNAAEAERIFAEWRAGDTMAPPTEVAVHGGRIDANGGCQLHDLGRDGPVHPVGSGERRCHAGELEASGQPDRGILALDGGCP